MTAGWKDPVQIVPLSAAHARAAAASVGFARVFDYPPERPLV